MATYTDFLNLELPTGSDYYNVGVTNANFQKLAAFLSSLSAEQVAYLNAAMDGVENVKQALDAQQVDLANKVNVGPSQEYDLSLSTGLVSHNACRFRKNSNSEVSINISVKTVDTGSSEVIAPWTVIATLPVGFRPNKSYECSCTVRGSQYVPGTVIIATNGQISVAHDVSNAKYVHSSTICFVSQ